MARRRAAEARLYPLAAHLLLLLPILLFLLAGGQPSAAARAGAKKALLVGLGGTRGDVLHDVVWLETAAPTVQRLMTDGAWAACASVEDPTCATAAAGNRHGSRPPTTRSAGGYESPFRWEGAPGWASVVSGADTPQHGVRGDEAAAVAAYAASSAWYPSVFARAKAAGLATAASGTAPFLSAEGPGPDPECVPGVLDAECNATCGDAASCSLDARAGQVADGGEDNRTAAFGVDRASAGDADLVMLHFNGVDAAGRAHGWNSTEQRAAVSAADALLGSVVAAVEAAAIRRGEEWLVLITADHGGHNSTSGVGWVSDEAVPFVVAVIGPDGAVPVRDLGAAPRQFDAAPTALSHLGVPLRPGDAPLAGKARGVAALDATTPCYEARGGGDDDNGRYVQVRTLLLSVLGTLVIGIVIGSLGARAAGRSRAPPGDSSSGYVQYVDGGGE